MKEKPKDHMPASPFFSKVFALLKEKTAGNLKGDEAKLLEQLIYELQMKYVAKTKKVDQQ